MFFIQKYSSSIKIATPGALLATSLNRRPLGRPWRFEGAWLFPVEASATGATHLALDPYPTTTKHALQFLLYLHLTFPFPFRLFFRFQSISVSYFASNATASALPPPPLRAILTQVLDNPQNAILKGSLPQLCHSNNPLPLLLLPAPPSSSLSTERREVSRDTLTRRANL